MSSERCADCLRPAEDGRRCCRQCQNRRNEALRRWRIRHREIYLQKQREAYHRRKKRDPDLSRRSAAKYKYGLTLEEYDAIIARGCAICGKSDGRIHLDHNHANGQVRDALCEPCNQAIGFMRDDPERLRTAAEYLELHAATVATT